VAERFLKWGAQVYSKKLLKNFDFRPLRGDFEGQGPKNNGGDRGKNNTKGAKTFNHYH